MKRRKIDFPGGLERSHGHDFDFSLIQLEPFIFWFCRHNDPNKGFLKVGIGMRKWSEAKFAYQATLSKIPLNLICYKETRQPTQQTATATEPNDTKPNLVLEFTRLPPKHQKNTDRGLKSERFGHCKLKSEGISQADHATPGSDIKTR